MHKIMRARRAVVLAVAVRAGWVGYVLLIDGVIKDWRISGSAAMASKAAANAMTKWIGQFDPDVIVLENHRTAVRKAQKTRRIAKSLYRTAKKSTAQISQVTREQHFPNKFLEAKALAERFPDLKPSVPCQHRLWEREPRNLVCFEALALAEQSGFLPAPE